MNKLNFNLLSKDFGVEGMNTPNIRGAINHYAKEAGKEGGTFVEVGNFQGQILCAAAYENPNTKVVGIDNFSQFNPKGRNEGILRNAIKRFPNIELIKTESLNGVQALIDRNERIHVLYYDADHTYAATLNALEKSLPLLTANAVVIVDDTNWKEVREVVRDFCNKNGFHIEFERTTPANGSKDWWNGFTVLRRGEKKKAFKGVKRTATEPVAKLDTVAGEALLKSAKKVTTKRKR